ncbi:MAG: PIN domain-containing protein [Patescibacteria group bacterium]
MAKILDANIVIRFLVEDDKVKTDAVEKLFRSEEILILTDVTISEIVWVLSSYYDVSRMEIVKKITTLIHLPSIRCDKKIVLIALSLFEKYNIDWIDAYLAAYAEENSIDGVYSYDRDLDKVKKIKRREP